MVLELVEVDEFVAVVNALEYLTRRSFRRDAWLVFVLDRFVESLRGGARASIRRYVARRP